MRRPPSRVSRGLRRALLLGALLALPAVALLGVSPAVADPDPDPTPTVSSVAGAYYPLSAVRLVGSGSAGALPTRGVAVAAAPVAVPVLGRFGLPASGASAAVVNLTASAAATRVTVQAQPRSRGVAALTVAPHTTGTTLVTVPLDSSGAFELTAVGGTATVTADLVGLYASDDTLVAALGALGGYQPLDPVRVLGLNAGASTPVAPVSPFLFELPDSGSGLGEAPSGSLPAPTPTVSADLTQALPAGAHRTVGLDLGSGLTEHATALVLRLTVPRPAASGPVSVTAGDGAPSSTATGTTSTTAGDSPSAVPTDAVPVPAVPTVTVATGTSSPLAAVTGLAVVPAHAAGDGLLDVTVTNGTAKPEDVHVDLLGYYDDGQLGPDLRFRALPATRVLDTRTATGAGVLTAGATRTVTPSSEVVGPDTFALVGSLTTVTGATATDLALSRAQQSTSPSASAVGAIPVPAAAQTTVPVLVEVGSSGSLVLAGGAGAARVVLDVVGSMEADPAVSDVASRAWVHATSPWQVRAVTR